MSRVTAHSSISLDGFTAGPDQSADDPIGKGGHGLHRWLMEPANAGDEQVRDKLGAQRGAYIMGRNMFSPGRGEWDLDWTGWWGDTPPYGAPVFVLTQHERAPLELTGTAFHFVTEGFDAALVQARDAAGDADIGIAGGASTVRQALAAGALDELTLDIVPILLGSGERLFDGVDDPSLEPIDVVHSPLATHVTYRVVRP